MQVYQTLLSNILLIIIYTWLWTFSMSYESPKKPYDPNGVQVEYSQVSLTLNLTHPSVSKAQVLYSLNSALIALIAIIFMDPALACVSHMHQILAARLLFQ